jgi:hypothetical protein
MKRWNLIFRVFTAEYLRLSPSTEPNKPVVVVVEQAKSL